MERITIEDKLKECVFFPHAQKKTVIGDIMTGIYGCPTCPKGYEPKCKGYTTKEMQYRKAVGLLLGGRI